MLNDDKMLISEESRKAFQELIDSGTRKPQQQQPAGLDEATRNQFLSLRATNAVRTTPGGTESRMAMFPDEYVDGTTDRMGAFERGYRSFASGFMSSIPGAMTQMGGIIDYLGADSAGQALTEQGMEWGDWINEHVAVEDPTLANQIASGFGSLAFFMLPGLGSAGVAAKTARGLGLIQKAGKSAGELSKAGRVFQTVFQAGTMATLEAAVEQSQRMEELIGQGQTPEEALKNSEGIFWQNMVMLTATNAPFFSPVGRLARGAMSGVSEGTQERMQAVIQEVAAGRGNWSDFMDPDKHRNETIVGFITGGTVGGILPGEGDGKKKDGKPTMGEQEEFEGDLPQGFDEDTQRMDDLEASGATDEELETFAGLIALERALEMEYGVDDLNLGERLSQDQAMELGRASAAAQNESDINKATKMEAEVVEMAKEMLFRNAEAAKGAPQSQDTKDAIEAEIDAEVDEFIAETETDRDAAAQESIEKTEREIGKPKLGDMIRKQPTAREQEILDAREAKKEEYRRDKESRARLKDPTGGEQQIIDEMPAGILEGVGAPTPPTQEQEPAAAQEPVNIEQVTEDLDATDRAIARLKAKKKRTPKEKRILKKLRKRRNELEAQVDRHQDEIYEPAQTGLLPEPGGQIAPVEQAQEEQGPASAEVFKETFPSEKPTLIDIHERAKKKAKKPQISGGAISKTEAVAAEQVTEEEKPEISTEATKPVEAIKKAAKKKATKKKAKAAPKNSQLTGEKLEKEIELITGIANDSYAESHSKGYFDPSVKAITVIDVFEEKQGGSKRGAEAVKKLRKDYETAKRLYGEAKPATKPKPAVKASAKVKAAGGRWTVFDVPMGEIGFNLEEMQNREEPYSEKSASEVAENYDENVFEPVDLYRNKDGKLEMVEGHSRFEGMKRRGADTIQAFIHEGMTFEEAKKLAQKKNKSKDAGSILDDVKLYRGVMADKSLNAKEKKAKAKNLFGGNANTVAAISHLKRGGSVVSALKSMQTAGDAELSSMMDMARWIGLARQNNPKLTDAHEQEMFTDLKKNFKQKSGRRNQQEFSAMIDSRTMTLAGFDFTKPLNLAGAVSRTPAQNEFDNILSEAESNSREATNTLEAKRAEFIKKGVTGTKLDELLKPYNDAVTIATREELDLRSRKQGINKNVQGESTLFDLSVSKQQALDDAADEAMAKGVDLGELNVVERSDTNSSFIKKIGKRFGVEVVFFEQTKFRGGIANGYFSEYGGKRVFINVKSTKPMMYVLGHEVGHYMEIHHPEAWGNIAEAAIASMRKGGIAAYKGSKPAFYSSDKMIQQEFISDIVAEQFGKEEFWNYLKAKDSKTFADLVNVVRSFLNTVKDFVKMSGSGMDKYMKNFASTELAVRESLSKVSMEERSKLGIEEDPAQFDLFKDAKPSQQALFSLDISDPQMAEKVTESDRVLKEVSKNQKRIRSGTDLGRLVYQKLVDKNTFLYKAYKKVLKNAGYDAETFDPTLNPYQAIRLMAGWANAAHQSLTDTVMSWDGTKHLSDGLQRIIRTHGIAAAIDNGEFGQFAQMMRMQAIFKVKGMNYFTGDPADIGSTDETFLNDEQREALEDYRENIKILDRYKAMHKGWADAVQDISDWNMAILQRARQAGLLTEDEFSRMVDKYELYVPMNVLEKEAGHAKKIAYELGVYKAGVVRMDPIDAMIKKAYRMEFLSSINHAKVTAAKLVETLAGGRSSLKDFGRRVQPKTKPLQDYIDIIASQQGVDMETADAETVQSIKTTAEMYAAAEFEKDGVVALKRDGELEYWQFAPDIMDVFTSQGGQQSQFWLKFFSAQTRMLRAGAILTPEFMATNQFRDFMGSMVLSQHLVKNPADFIQVIPRIITGFNEALAHAQGKPVKTAQEFINAGAGNATFVSPDMAEIRKESKDLTKGQKFLRHKSPITILQEITNLFEYSTRFAVFRKTVDDLVAAGVPYDEAVATGAIEAREASTDFARMGEYGAVINRIIPFFNAGIQGNDKLYRSLFVDKGRKAQTWTKGALLITAPSVALWVLNHDEEWYRELPLYIKNHFWTFSFDGGKTIHKLPKPFEIGMIFGSLPERILDWHYDEDPRAMKEWVSNFQKDLVPFSGLSLLGPTLATMHEIQSNHSVYQGTPIVKGYKADIMPSEQYTSRTSEFAKVLGGAAPGKGVSPMMIDHFVRGTFGGLGTWGTEIASNVIMAFKPELREKRRASKDVYGMAKDWWPIVRRVVAVGPPSYTRNMEDFFKEYDNARETYNTFTAFSSGGASREQFENLYHTDGAGLEQYKVLQEGMKMAADISKKMATIQQAGSDAYSREEKAELLDNMQRARNKVFKDVMKSYNSVNWDDVQKKMDKQVDKVMSQWDRANGGK